MGLQSIGQNGTEEFFETILYGVAYEEAQAQVKGMTSDISNDLAKEALVGMMTVITSGLIFLLMRKQEDFIQGVFDTAKGLVTILLGTHFAQKMKGRLGGLRGTKLFKKLSMFKSSYSDRIATAQLVVNGTNSHFHAERTTQSETTSVDSVIKSKEHIVNKESHSHAVGSSMASRYNETLMFKLFTKSFTAKDKTLIKKMLGRDSNAELDIEDMNKVADFMFVTDDNGNTTGLAEQFLTLLNGMGYTHKK